MDLVNLASIAFGYSIGGFDADRFVGERLTLGIGREGEPYEGIGRGQLNICGLPGVSVPCGFDAQGLPIGMQLIGNSFEEAKILNAAWQYENAAGKFKAAGFGVRP